MPQKSFVSNFFGGAVHNGRLHENNSKKILFSHDILLSLQQAKWFFEMAK